MHDILSSKQRPICAIVSLFSFLLVLSVSTFSVHAIESDMLTGSVGSLKRLSLSPLMKILRNRCSQRSRWMLMTY